jgi:Cutinase
MSIGARARSRILVVIIAVAALLLALVMPSVTGSSRALAQTSSAAINPTQGAPGTSVTGTGVNWPAGDHIQAVWDGTTGNYVGSPAVVNPDFSFTVTFSVPSDAAAGSHVVVFWDSEGRYFETASTPFTVDSNPSPSPSGGCAAPSHWLLGLHGMNEGPSPTNAAGETVESTWQYFQARAKQLNISTPYSFQDISYATTDIAALLTRGIGAFDTDVQEGVDNLEAAIQSATALCPSTTFTLVGYSEGAWVVTNWVHAHPAEVSSHVKAIELYGDPLWYRHDSEKALDYQGLARIGGKALDGPPYPIQNTPYLVQTLCFSSGDPVCGEGYADAGAQLDGVRQCVTGGCAHKNYATSGATKQGGEFLADHAFTG